MFFLSSLNCPAFFLGFPLDAIWRDLSWSFGSSTNECALFDLSMGLLSFEADANLCYVRKFAASCFWRHWRCRVMPNPEAMLLRGLLRRPFKGPWSNPSWSVLRRVSISFVFHATALLCVCVYVFFPTFPLCFSSMGKTFPSCLFLFPIISTFYITLGLIHRPFFLLVELVLCILKICKLLPM